MLRTVLLGWSGRAGASARWLGVGVGGGCGRALSSRAAGGAREPVALREEDLDESFVKGSGKGGQKINKVRNCVLLKHRPSGLLVRCQKTRSLDDNRRVARKLLLQKLDDHVNGALSARSTKIDRLRKKKRNKRARSRDKYAPRAGDGDDEAEVDSDSDSGNDGDESEDDSEDDSEDEDEREK